MERQYQFSGNFAFNISYHIVFCPKRRKSVLVDDIAKTLEELIYYTVKELGCQVESCKIMPDHVNLFISGLPTISPHNLIKSIKRRSSRILREKFPQLKKLPAMWSRSYYVDSIGVVSDSVVKKYIENQKGK